MNIILDRGSIYYCRRLKLLTGKNSTIICDKYILLLQGGNFFRKSNKVNILLGTSKKTEVFNIYPTDVLIEAKSSDFPENTKFNCGEIYIMHKVDVLKSEYKFQLSNEQMEEIGKKLILGLQIS